MACWRALLVLVLLVVLLGGAALAGAGAPRCAAPRCQLVGCRDSDGKVPQCDYTVDGLHLRIKYSDGGYFSLECLGNLTLNYSAVPRFESQLRVFKVLLKKCQAPLGSYGAELRRLNVSVSEKLRLEGAGRLAAAQLAALGPLRALELVDVELAPRALAAPAALHSLFLDSVRLPPAELRQLPPGLRMLELMRVGADVPADVLARLPHLTSLTVRDSSNVSVAVGGALQALALDMPAVRVPSALAPTLLSLTVFGWAERSPAPWTTCALDSLTLRDVAAEALPARWLGACANLTVLHVDYGSQLRALHASALRGAHSLRELRLASCKLEALPAGLLDDAVQLRVLDLSRNILKELPSGLFVRTRSLQTLNLSKNRLTSDVYWSLKAVTSLSSLTLSYNELRDSCGSASDTVRDVSPLQSLTKLTNLELRKTGTTLLCRDWRENMPLLTKLDLSQNNFSTLTYADLQFRGSENVDVDLTGNNVRRLLYTEQDYRLATGGAAPSQATVTLDDTLDCDCHTYWAARALRDRDHVALTARCARGASDVRAVDLESLVCAEPALCAGAPPGCACARRDSGVPAPARLLRVSCERAGLARLPDVLAPLAAAARRQHAALEQYDLQLYLAHNRIADLNATDVPKHLSVLDLRNNSLSLLSEDVVRALLADEQRRVLLAHNKLECNCSVHDTLSALSAHRAALDYNELTCADGTQLARAAAVPCAPPRGLSAGAVAAAAALVTLLAAAVVGGLLWHPALRLRLKAALHDRGWLPGRSEPDDDERRYDVFLSFSHGDERFVRDELVAQLESGPAPYRLCVHYRDWLPGGWIPAQIAASVRASRRTVAVVSAHFLRSAWARAEFQEAYALALRDARPRLVVVLLDDPAALPLDDRLRSYLATNTYVRWGDPWFWQKLRLALPRGRGPASPAPPPAPVEPLAAGGMCSEPSVVSARGSSQSSSCSSASTAEAIELHRLVEPLAAGDVCAEPSARGSPQSSSSSSSSSSCSSADAVELRGLVAPASCGAQLAGDVTARACARAGAVPV